MLRVSTTQLAGTVHGGSALLPRTFDAHVDGNIGIWQGGEHRQTLSNAVATYYCVYRARLGLS